MNAPDFLIIPSEVACSRAINPTAKIIYGLVYWMTQLKGETCYASNRTLADLAQVQPRVVQESLRRLEQEHFIERKFDPHQPNRRLRECIRPLVIFRGVRINGRGGVRTNVPQSYSSPNKKKNKYKEVLERITDLARIRSL